MLNREDVLALLKSVPDVGLSDEQAEKLVDGVLPLIGPVDFKDKTFVVHIPMDGKLGEIQLKQCYAYADQIKAMGAKNVLFLPSGTVVYSVALKPEEVTVLSSKEMLGHEEVAQYTEWLRIARGGDGERIAILGDSGTLESLCDEHLALLGLRRV